MPPLSDTSIGPYEIRGKIGAGGMGEVYRAFDARLGREVAIKVLPDALAHDPERLARFEREARLLAALSHAGIASIYGVEQHGTTWAIVMELVEGPTLDERIARGALPEDEVLAVARPLAEAIEAAHDRGIVHRDLKPANVKLRPDGTVKVLDFGLARAIEGPAAPSPSDLTQSPTMTQRMTTAGLILGTAAYMSPEQARGREADRRADVWAFGVIVYEMLTGRRAFTGETVTEMLAAVMRDEPDWSALPAGLSPRWRRLLGRCLDKDPKRRLQSIGEARIALEDLAAHPKDANADGLATPAPPGRASLVPWLVAAVAVAALAVALARRPAPPFVATELSIVPAAGEEWSQDEGGFQPMAIAPDGRSVAYTVRSGGQLRLRLRRLDTREDIGLAGTDGARNLFFSSDGQWVGYFDSHKMYKVSVRGGAPVELAPSLQDRLGTWLDDGTIVYAPEVTQPLYRIPETGGTPVAVTTLDTTRRERTHRFPSALDGGPWVVFTVQTVDSPGGYDDASIDAINVKTHERRHLFKGARRAVWAPGGHLILARGNDLFAVRIDPRDPRIQQDPVPVLTGVTGDASSGASYFGIANDGTIAWIPGGTPVATREVGWMDRSGRWTPTTLAPGPYLGFRLAPDKTHALFCAGVGGGSSDLWLVDLRSGATNQLTHGSLSGPGAWFPDGVHIAHSKRNPSGGEQVVVRRLDGAGGEQVIFSAPNPLAVTDVTPDGRAVVVSDYGLRNGHLRLVPADGSGPPREFQTEGDGYYEQAGLVSPDGQWISYISNRTGREDVYLRRLQGGGTWQVSPAGGSGVRWGRDSRELFFVGGETVKHVVLTMRGTDIEVGQPETLFEFPATATWDVDRDYDFDRAGDRFLVTRPPRGVAERHEIALSLGWARRLGEMLRGPTSPAR
jgi:eukaryotic-like serine/threonine-protein kinase